MQTLPAFAGFETPATRRDDNNVFASTERLLYSSLSLFDDDREDDTTLCEHRAAVDGTAVKATVLAHNNDTPTNNSLFMLVLVAPL